MKPIAKVEHSHYAAFFYGNPKDLKCWTLVIEDGDVQEGRWLFKHPKRKAYPLEDLLKEIPTLIKKPRFKKDDKGKYVVYVDVQYEIGRNQLLGPFDLPQ